MKFGKGRRWLAILLALLLCFSSVAFNCVFAEEGAPVEEPAKQDNLKPEVKAVAISSVKNNAKKTVTVKWKKSAKAKGYQIWYSTKKNFKGKKVINIKKGKTVKVKVKKLKKKTYYFKIRVLEKINGKKIYSLWSKVKKVKVKK